MLDFIKKYYIYIISVVAIIILGAFANSFVQEKMKKEKAEILHQYEKNLEEETNKWQSLTSELKSEVNKLKSENTTLRTKSKTVYYKIVKPDGTTEIRKESETQSDFEKQITEQIKSQYEQKLTEAIKEEKSKNEAEISSLKKQLESTSYQKPVAKLHAIEVGYGLGLEGLIALDPLRNMYHLRYSFSLFDPIFISTGIRSNGFFHGVDLGVGFRF